MRAGGVAVRLGLAFVAGVGALRCATFGGGSVGPSDDAGEPDDAIAPDANAPEAAPNAIDAGADAPCWPPPLDCSGDDVCCLDFAGSGTCMLAARCPVGRTQLQCLRSADCPAAAPYCCAVVHDADPDSGQLQVVHDTCEADPSCPAGDRACVTATDCDAGQSCTPFSHDKYPQGGVFFCL